MPDDARKPSDPEPTEAQVAAVVEEFGGDLQAAVRALLHDLAVLAANFAAAVSRGYVRGETSPGADRVAARQHKG